MSWYSKIYIDVKKYRAKNPIRGWILTKCLNVMLFLQMILFSASFYVLMWHICTTFIPYKIQATIYICIYCSFGFMAVWSLLATIFSPVARVPERYKKTKQIQILDEICAEMCVMQAECDSAGRPMFCYVCEVIKPDRTHHCSSCGFCVVHFDHHCPWINHCVSYSNYKKFILYVTYSTITLILFLLMAIEGFFRFWIRQHFSEDWISLVLTLFIGLTFSVFGYYPLGELVQYHFGLICINETTCDQAKPAVLKNDHKADYNIGKWDNFQQRFGWGLWLFPINTHIEDGVHFKIRYDDDSNKVRYIRVERTPSSHEQAQSPNIPARPSRSVPTATPVATAIEITKNIDVTHNSTAI